MKPYIPIDIVLRSVAAGLARGTDHGATTIRCAINDELDSLERAGYRVRHDYSQARAVRKVQEILEHHRLCRRS